MRDPDQNETIALVSGKRVGACLFFVYISNRTILELSRFLVIIRTMRDPDRNETIALVSGKRVGACLFFVFLSNRTIPPKAGKNRIVELTADLCIMRNPDRNETIALVSRKRVGARFITELMK